MYEYYFTSLLLFGIIAALLRQLNKERAERYEAMSMYRELALRVRNVQLATESPEMAEHYVDWDPKTRGATVMDVEGV